eukprot:Opistho-2@28783
MDRRHRACVRSGAGPAHPAHGLERRRARLRASGDRRGRGILSSRLSFRRRGRCRRDQQPWRILRRRGGEGQYRRRSISSRKEPGLWPRDARKVSQLAALTIFPAIDLKRGQVVRLAEGDMARATVYGDDPAAQARLFAGAGASHLHVVDLDGAFAGESVNGAAVESIIAAFPMYSALI